jgi:hypothetical protein
MKAPEFGAGDYNYITNQYMIYNMISIDADKFFKKKISLLIWVSVFT